MQTKVEKNKMRIWILCSIGLLNCIYFSYCSSPQNISIHENSQVSTFLIPFESMEDKLNTNGIFKLDSLIELFKKTYSFKYLTLSNLSNYCELKNNCLYFNRCRNIINYLELKGIRRSQLLIRDLNLYIDSSTAKEIDSLLLIGRNPKEICKGKIQGVSLGIIQ